MSMGAVIDRVYIYHVWEQYLMDQKPDSIDKQESLSRSDSMSFYMACHPVNFSRQTCMLF